MFKSYRYVFTLAAVAAVSAVFVYHDTNTLTTVKYTIPVKNLPPRFNGFTILHLSDLHSKRYGKRQEHLLAEIRKNRFDMVALTGDFVDERGPATGPGIDLTRALLRDGKRRRPVFFVPGNHEHSSRSSIDRRLERLGAHVLVNRRIKLERGASRLWVVGIDDPYSKRHRLDAALMGAEDREPRILLAHAPDIFAEAADRGIDLLLVGHTHAGQIRAPGIGALWVPGQGFFPKFDYGLFRRRKTRMIITAGVGETLLSARAFSRPEIVLIKLVKE